MSDNTCARLLELLARWQAFSELQQRAFEFLAAEAVATGQEFEHSTDGATGVLTRIGQLAADGDSGELQQETFQVVQKLQAADRSRQGLEQVASVLQTLQLQHADLVNATRETAHVPETDAMLSSWIDAMAANVNLADWRRRLVDALHGREPSPAAAATEEDDELF
ncbi:MAG TPA: hypothetical protein VK196_12480 [Magnetospirillum sp.]|nr:hypothetical protein [Magnetospirillum sp.]